MTTATAEAPELLLGNESKQGEADKIVRKYVLLTSGTGLIPLPLVDLAAITTMQMLMIRSLSNLYGIPFSEQRSKTLITALLSGSQMYLIANSFAKFIPVLGYIGWAAPAALTAGTLTYAIGRVFTEHFELGGTLLDFDADKVKNFFADKLKEGRTVTPSIFAEGQVQAVTSDPVTPVGAEKRK